MKAIFVSQFRPAPVGHGGNHRAYQIVHDLGHIVGPDNVVVVSWPQWLQSCSAEAAISSMPMKQLLSHRGRRVGLNVVAREVITRVRGRLKLRTRARRAFHGMMAALVDYPTALLAGTGSTIGQYSAPDFVRRYEELVRSIHEPAVCVIEHAGFASLLSINARYGIPTISCIENIESFDLAAPLRYAQKRKTYLATLDFADEFRVLAQCHARLFISTVEVGLVGGLGLPSNYYPYLPVGAIRKNLERIRMARRAETVQSGFFLMLGSGAHATTWESFRWFVRNAAEWGLPDGIRIVVGGTMTDKLLPPGVEVAGLEMRGWIEQDELNRLLARAQAVLAPQTMGFGALTRLPELACAGVPAVVSRHATHAVDVPPGVEILDDDWHTWCRRMKLISSGATAASSDDYDAWAQKQPNPLRAMVRRLLVGAGQRQPRDQLRPAIADERL